MKTTNVTHLFEKYHADKKAGVQRGRGPLHTAYECCEAAGITFQRYQRLCITHPPAPEPRLVTVRGNKPTKMFDRKQFVAWVKAALAQEN